MNYMLMTRRLSQVKHLVGHGILKVRLRQTEWYIWCDHVRLILTIVF